MPQSHKNILTISFLLILFSCAGEYVAIDNDTSLLYVISTVPKDGAKRVQRDLAPSGAVLINFSKAIDERFITEDFFDFSCDGVKPESKISVSEDKKTVSIKLKQGVVLPEGAQCRVVISKLIKDSSGLPFYLSGNIMSNPLDVEDAGIKDISVAADTSDFEGNKDKRSGEGDYIFEFVTDYEPLKILSVSPEDKSIVDVEGIADFRGIQIKFNKPLDERSVNSSNFLVSGEPTELALSEDKQSVTINLINGIKEGKRYDYIVMPFVTDISNIILGETYNFSFSVGYIRPRIVSVTPPDGAQDVPYNLKEIKIEFNKEMDPETINNYTILLSGIGDYSVRYENKVVYIENFSLKENREYKVMASSEIEDTSGFNLDKNYYFGFKTTYDAPYIKKIFPSDKAQNIPNNLSSIDIEFSEEMDFSNLDISYFNISPTLPFSLKIVDSRRLKVNLLSPLLSNNTYTIQVKNFLSDISGIRMDKDFVSTFTVAPIPDNNPPSDIVIYSKPILNPEEDYRRGFIIEWRSPAADEINGKLSGKVKGYSLVYSDRPFDKSEFADMTELSQIPTPSNPGDIQNIILYSFVDKDNNEVPIIYNKPYYFMLRATDGTNFVYSNLLKAGILSENKVMLEGSKYLGYSMKFVDNFNGEKVLITGDTDELYQQKRTGAVYIYKISGDNLDIVYRIFGKYDGSLFGYKVDAVDINNDGCKDLVISAPLDGEDREGAVYIYPQIKSGGSCVFNESEPKRLSPGNRDSMFGSSISTIIFTGKENLLIGAPADGELSSGSVYVFYNNEISQIPQTGNLSIKGKITGSSFGYSVASGDINNDGCSDIIISSLDADELSRGKVYIFYSTSGVGGCSIQNTNVDNVDLVINGTRDYMRLGYNILTLDMNGDSRIELVLSGRDEVNNRGVVFIRDSKTQNLIEISGESGGNFGFYLQSAHDYLKDGCKGSINTGCNDLIVSDEKIGRVYLIEGREDISGLTLNESPLFGAEYSFGSLGFSSVVIEDGGFERLIIASPFYREFGDFVSKILLYK